MIIVAGSLLVAAEDRDRYVGGCEEVVARARRARGCLDFALSADLVDPKRINVYECWASRDDLERFRGAGPEDGQMAQLEAIRVHEYRVTSA